MTCPKTRPHHPAAQIRTPPRHVATRASPHPGDHDPQRAGPRMEENIQPPRQGIDTKKKGRREQLGPALGVRRIITQGTGAQRVRWSFLLIPGKERRKKKGTTLLNMLVHATSTPSLREDSDGR